MARKNGQFNYSSNYEVQITAPLDSRILVDNINDLIDENTWKSGSDNYLYKGIVVSVKENDSLYMLTNVSGYTNINSWKKLNVDLVTSTGASQTLAATQSGMTAAYKLAETANTKASSTASTGAYGVTKLSSSTASTSETVAATPKAVKYAYDLANSANTKANNAYSLASSTASTGAYGVTKLVTTTGTSQSLAATQSGMTTAYKLAETANTKANSAYNEATGNTASINTLINTKASISTYGLTKLSNSTSSPNDESHAATSKAVAAVSSLANSAYDKATANTASINTLISTKASTGVYGLTKLSNSTSSNAEDIAATPKAVKSAYDLANSAYNLASSTASTGAYGVTKLSNSTSSTAENLAATPKAVKSAYDLANSANTKANSAYNLASSTASTSVYGVTKLSSSTSSNAEDIAATLKAVKSAYDLASSAKTKADTAVTGIQMNGGLKTKNTNGVVNLGTVITSLTAATTAVTGVVRLSNSTSSPNDESHAATSKAVAAVSSLANSAYDKATANTESINALSSSVVKKIQMNANVLSPNNGLIDLGFVNGTPVTWDASKNMNDFTNPGIYLISGQRTSGTDNLPIYNTGSISGRLVVITSNNCVSQILTLSNAGGGDTNIYTRTKQGEVWEPWGKLQSNIEVGQIGFGTPYTFDDFTDNGMYSGVNLYWVNSTSTYSAETFVLVVINGYLYGGGITQLKYSIMADGKVNLHTRKKMGNSNWSDWEMYGGLQNTYYNTDTQTLLPDNSIVDKGLNSLKETGLYYGTHINNIDYGGATKIHPFVLATFDNGSLANRTGISQLKINTNYNEGVVLETRRYNNSNNTWTDWLTISGKDTIPEIIVDGLNRTTTEVNIEPNTYYKITNFNDLTINFLSGVDNILKNYMLEITLDKDAPIRFTNTDIKWADGISPVWELNNTYQISIINNLGVFTVFTNN